MFMYRLGIFGLKKKTVNVYAYLYFLGKFA